MTTATMSARDALLSLLEEATKVEALVELAELDKLVSADERKWAVLLREEAGIIKSLLPSLKPLFSVAGVAESVTLIESAASDAADAIASTAAKKTQAKMTKAAVDTHLKATSLGYDGMAKTMGLSFKIAPARAVKVASQSAAKLVKNVGESTMKELRRIVTDGVKSGASYNTTAKLIQASLGPLATAYRAKLIAVTENAMAYGRGKELIAQDVQSAGVKMEKSWHIRDDGKVCDKCRAAADAKWIPADDSFPGGIRIEPAHPGCRCVIPYRMAQAKPLTVQQQNEIAAKALQPYSTTTTVQTPRTMSAEEFEKTLSSMMTPEEYAAKLEGPQTMTPDFYPGEEISRREAISELYDYRNFGYKSLNEGLRTGAPTEEVLARARKVDSLFRGIEPKTMTLYRGDGGGISADLFEKIPLPDDFVPIRSYSLTEPGKWGADAGKTLTDLYKGAEFTDEAFLSASSSRASALKGFVQDGSAEVSKYGGQGLAIIKGKVTSIDMNATLGKMEFGPGKMDEKEHLLPRRSKFRVERVEVVQNSVGSRDGTANRVNLIWHLIAL